MAGGQGAGFGIQGPVIRRKDKGARKRKLISS